MSKHTPGPWKVFDYGEYPGIDSCTEPRRAIVVYSDDDDEPCGVCGETKEERIANARLIAAAPDMLEALKAAIDCRMVPFTTAAEGGASKYSRQVIVADMIRAAIAKAEGKG